VPFGAPPGLELPEFEPKAPAKKGVALSLADLCAPPKGRDGGQSKVDKPMKIRPPPGFDKLMTVAPPPGLSLLTDETDFDSDDTSAGGQAYSDIDDSGDSDAGQAPSPSGLVLAEVSQLKGDAPMFRPLLTPGAAAMLFPSAEQATPQRTKLQSKAQAYVPSPAAHAWQLGDNLSKYDVSMYSDRESDMVQDLGCIFSYGAENALTVRLRMHSQNGGACDITYDSQYGYHSVYTDANPPPFRRRDGSNRWLGTDVPYGKERGAPIEEVSGTSYEACSEAYSEYAWS
jgi:hypothetical protein